MRFYDQAVTPRVSVTVSLMQEMASYLNRPAKAPVTDYTIAGASHGPVVIMIYKAGQKQANK